MTAQVAIACVLLVGASLLVRSFTAMLHADVGYDATNVLTAEIALPESGYAPERRGQIMDEIVQRLARVDGVTRAAFATGIPFAGGVTLQTFTLPPPGGGAGIDAQAGMREVSPGYFAAIGQNVLEGRAFAADDTAAAPPVAIVNREFSRRYLADRALGRTLPGFAPSKSKRPTPDRTIVGVVGDTARQSVADAAEPEVYVPSAQQPLRYSELYLVVRTVGDPRALTPVVRSIARQAAKAAAVDSIMTLEDRTAETLTRPRLYAVLLGTFAAFALAIAGVGLFGVLSYSVAQRSREIGVRSALGARVRDIIGLVVGQSMAIAITGLAIGLVASAWLMGLLQKFLFGVTPHDFVSFGAVAGVLLLVAAVASVVPARRAARVDPVQVLRG
jgi:putative ABC transport system permease protein